MAAGASPASAAGLSGPWVVGLLLHNFGHNFGHNLGWRVCFIETGMAVFTGDVF